MKDETNSENIIIENSTDDKATNQTTKTKESNKNKPKKLGFILSCLFALIAIISIACNIFIIMRYKIKIETIDGKPTILSENQYNAIKRNALSEVTDTVTGNIKETIKKRLIEGDSATYLLRTYYPDHIVYMDEGYYKFVEINPNLKKNTLSLSNFKTSDKGIISYADENITSVKGIDISKYQGNIDFTKVKEDDISYAMIRVGRRGSNEGLIEKDPKFDTNATNALANGIEIGAYFFSQAITKEEAIEEANYVLDAIKGYNVTYPIVIDVEEVENVESRMEKLNATERTDVIIAFCDTIKAAGYTPMIYSNIRYYCGKMEYDRLENYDKWFASYSTQLYFPYEISMWQYTNTGSVSGITGNVDINVCFKKY